MFTGNAEAVAREQHNDRLRQIEKAYQIEQVEQKNNRFNVRQIAKNWFKPAATSQQAAVCGEAKLA